MRRGMLWVGGFMVGLAMLVAPGHAQDRPRPATPSRAEGLGARAQAALNSGELEAAVADARHVLELIARDPEVANAVLRAAQATDPGQRQAALEALNLVIKTKSSSHRLAAGASPAVAPTVSDVSTAGRLIKIRFKRCKRSPDGTETCTEVEIQI